MKILSVASECAPFVKTGGLADVVGALPKALAADGTELRVLLPLYPALYPHAEQSEILADFGGLFGGASRLLGVRAEGLSLLLLEAPHLFDRGGGIYLDETGRDWPDNPQRFAALCDVAARIAMDGVQGWVPDLVHAHDWQAGLAPWYLRQRGSHCPTVITIHNIAFQGVFDAGLMTELHLDPAGFTPEGFEYYGKIGFLKAGILSADRITTVSPTYARELMTPEFGMGLEGLLAARKADLRGIVNGIDLDIWNPETDTTIARPYTARTLGRKTENRDLLEQRFALRPNAAAPLFCVISRLTAQKGLDLLLETLPTLVARGARLAVLGSGEAWMEAAFRKAALDHPGQVGVIIGYDEKLSHLMQAGSDAILVPSRFEPCGLTQLYGLRYGTLPVVARTGGLADTVIDGNDAALATGCGTGVQFSPVTASGLAQAIDRTCDLFGDQKQWQAMMRRAMRQPVGWETSAKAYGKVFAEACGQTA